MIQAILVFLAVAAVFYIFGSPKPASAALAFIFVACQRAAKLFLVLFLVSASVIAFALVHEYVTERDAKEKASRSEWIDTGSTQWSQYEVKAAHRTPARRATP